MEAILTDDHVEIRVKEAARPGPDVDVDDKTIELGIWLSGLHSYLGSGVRFLFQNDNLDGQKPAVAELRIAHSGLKRCVILTSYILSHNDGVLDGEDLVKTDVSAAGLGELSNVLREAMLVSGSMIDSTTFGPGEWRAFSSLVGNRLESLSVFYELIHLAEKAGMRFLPARLANLVDNAESLTPELAELVLVLPRFGMVLKYLSVVKRMLDADKPLKSSLLIFSRVNELVLDLTKYISNRLDRFPNQDAELFSTLDAASYTASIELKKVYTQELAGIAAMRPPPSIYARVETAYSLLNDGFQQILAGFIRLVQPDVDIFDVFPEFRVKLERSLVLRSDLWSTLKIVKLAENAPERENVEKMKRSLTDFRQGSTKHLFYKDTDTVERFIEEILVTDQNKDLVPILHRFGAFLDTLFGQVTLRSVLQKHPFEEA